MKKLLAISFALIFGLSLVAMTGCDKKADTKAPAATEKPAEPAAAAKKDEAKPAAPAEAKAGDKKDEAKPAAEGAKKDEAKPAAEGDKKDEAKPAAEGAKKDEAKPADAKKDDKAAPAEKK